MPRTPSFALIVCSAAIAVAGTALLSGATAVSTVRQDPATASAPAVVEVTAYRFAFEPSVVEVTQGDRVRLVVTAADGVHGLAVKKLKINKVLPRKGATVTIDFVAPAPGRYEILCSEYCGEGHDGMKGVLVVRAKATR